MPPSWRKSTAKTAFWSHIPHKEIHNAATSTTKPPIKLCPPSGLLCIVRGIRENGYLKYYWRCTSPRTYVTTSTFHKSPSDSHSQSRPTLDSEFWFLLKREPVFRLCALYNVWADILLIFYFLLLKAFLNITYTASNSEELILEAQASPFQELFNKNVFVGFNRMLTCIEDLFIFHASW